MLFRKKFSNKLRMAIILAAIIPVIIITGFIYYQSKMAADQSITTLGDELDSLQQNITFFRKELTDISLDLASILPGFSPYNKPAIQAHLEKDKRLNKICFYDTAARMLVWVGDEKFRPDEQKLIWKRSAREPLWAPIKTERGKTYIQVSIPRQQGTPGNKFPAGFWLAELEISDFISRFKEALKNVRGNIYLINTAGDVLFSAGNPEFKLPPFRPGEKITIARGENIKVENRNGISFLRILLPVKGTGMYLVYERPMVSYGASLVRLALIPSILLVLALVIIVILSAVISNRLASPLEELTRGTIDIAAGNYDRPLKTKDRGDEIDHLAFLIEKMRASLKELSEENISLMQRGQNLLEMKIGDLETVHSISETFTGTLESEKIPRIIAGIIKNLYTPDLLTFYVRSGDEGFILAESYGLSAKDVDRARILPMPGRRNTLYPLVTDYTPLYINEPVTNLFLRERLPLRTIITYFAVPLIARGKIVGLMEIGMGENRSLPENQRNLLTMLGREAGVALANATLYEEIVEDKEKISLILSSMGEGVFTVDENQIIRSFNKAAERIMDIKEEEVIGQPCYKIFSGKSPEGKILCSKDLCPAFRTAYPEPFEMTVRTRMGDEKVLHFTPSRFRGEGKGMVVIFRDVSRDRAVDEMKSRFISSLTHELRTPIASIKASLSNLRHPRATMDQEQYAMFTKIIAEETERLNRMLGDLLEVSKFESETLKPEPKPAYIEKIVEEVIAGFRSDDEHHEYRVVVDCSSQALADRHQVEFVLSHLTRNAARFTPSGGTIVLEVKDTPNEVITNIYDEGPGINDKSRRESLEILQSSENSRRMVSGMGMGLYLARQIIEAHGGRIWASVGQTGGACFSFSLPKAGLFRES
ncbi:MAG: PAS domain-containing protein [Candidatus Eremiobacteraeota bacterium]|nr:PAS domain-containing protein [Candidatus Eremiobacteraeota bacterium]